MSFFNKDKTNNANLGAGKTTGPEKPIDENLTDEEKANIAKGLNKDGTEIIKPEIPAPNEDSGEKKEEYVPTEFVINEIMHQKSIGREDAIAFLKEHH